MEHETFSHTNHSLDSLVLPSGGDPGYNRIPFLMNSQKIESDSSVVKNNHFQSSINSRIM